ncbi:ribosomal protein L1 [Xylariaceae sp. FL0016]|nr:ribosomal protein L1 [Xylariaceae sp. FL0016]
MAPKAVTNGTSESLVDPEQTLKASRALLSHLKSAAQSQIDAKKNLLAGDDEDPTSEIPVLLTVTTKRHVINSRSLKPGKVVLPHPLNTDPELSVCLITAEPQRHYKNLVASDSFPTEWRSRVGRVIDLAKLKAKYKSFEQQRQLYSEHDIFLGDTRILNRLPGILGKTFYKNTTKRPIPVEISARRPKVDGKRSKLQKGPDNINSCTAEQLAGEIERAVSAALIHLTPSTQTAIRVGLANWKPEHIAANVEVVMRALIQKFIPGKSNNVRGVYLKGPQSVALPIWQTDELWTDAQKDIVADDSEEAKKLLQSEKANVGKKRKSLEGEPEEAAPEPKKSRKTRSSKPLTESDDTKLDKEIAERKAALKKQKKAAKKALDI